MRELQPSTANPASAGARARRGLILLIGAAIAAAVLVNGLTDHDQGGGVSDPAHLVTLAAWGALALAYAWMRWRPRRPYDAAAVRSKTEAFQAKRWRLLMLLAGYLAFLMVPLGAVEALRLRPMDTAIDRLFDAVLFLAPCGLTLGLMTNAIYSKAWGAVVDDELTTANRARAYAAGFGVAIGLGAAGFTAALFWPMLWPAIAPVAIGLAVAAAATRFALLERAAALADG